MSRRKVELIETFILNVRRLARDVAADCPADAGLGRVRDRIFLAADVLPSRVVDEVGFYLYKYREQILALGEGDVAFFISADFSEDLSAAQAQAGEDENDKVKICRTLIPQMQSLLARMDEEKQKKYCSYILDMFDSYIELLQIQAEEQ